MQITLEGHQRPVPVEPGDTILASLLRAGLPFPFSCQAGNCGTCKCELVSGDVHELERSDSERALVTMCCGGGLGTGTILERA